MLTVLGKRQLCSLKITRGNICAGYAELASYAVDAHEEVILAVFKPAGFGYGTGCKDLNDAALYKACCDRRIFKLLADGDLISCLDEPVGIGRICMERNAAHRRPVARTAVSSGKSEFKDLRGLYRIIEKHLIEVAEPVQKERIPALLLHLGIVLHHGRKLFRL